MAVFRVVVVVVFPGGVTNIFFPSPVSPVLPVLPVLPVGVVGGAGRAAQEAICVPRRGAAPVAPARKRELKAEY